MQTTSDPLRFPGHFPPKTRWDKFFLGVRWIGPDLSFFKALRKREAARSAELMEVWDGGLRQELAEGLAQALKKNLRWKTGVFLPQDSFVVICHGPSFDWGSPFALEMAIEDFEDRYEVKVPAGFWQDHDNATFGDVVDGLLSLVVARLR